MTPLARLLSDDPAGSPFLRGMQLGLAQANALVCPVAAVILDSPGFRAAYVLFACFGWAAWAQRGFVLHARALPGLGRRRCTVCGAPRPAHLSAPEPGSAFYCSGDCFVTSLPTGGTA